MNDRFTYNNGEAWKFVFGVLGDKVFNFFCFGVNTRAFLLL